MSMSQATETGHAHGIGFIISRPVFIPILVDRGTPFRPIPTKVGSVKHQKIDGDGHADRQTDGARQVFAGHGKSLPGTGNSQCQGLSGTQEKSCKTSPDYKIA